MATEKKVPRPTDQELRASYEEALTNEPKTEYHAKHILLATEAPRALSARNVLEGKIVSLERRGTLVAARVDCGAIFAVHVTPGAERTLELAREKKVWLVLKTHSCHFVEG